MLHRNIFAEEAVLQDLPAQVEHTAFGYGYPVYGTGKGVRIAIIDTGKPDHLGIADAIESVNFADSYTPNDTIGQSTIVAGIIAASQPGKMIGIATDVELYFAKINREDGKVSIDAFISAYLWAIIKNVDIIVMPMTTDHESDIFRDTVQKAINSNICVICSAGFDGYTQYPPSYPGVLSVGALKQSGEKANFSGRGRVNAFGTSICSTYVNQSYCVASGSACATAIVGGITAIVVEEAKAKGQFDPIKVCSHIEALYKGSSNG